MKTTFYILFTLATIPTLCSQEQEEIDILKNKVEELIEINIQNERRITSLETILNSKDDPDINQRVTHLEALTRTKVHRSCHELALLGITESAFYEIDPDGEARGELPIQVYCDFEDGVTEILHDADEATWTVPHCEDEFCAEKRYSFKAPMSQIQALIELSHSCSQEIVYDCFLAPLFYNDVFIGAWTDRWGEMQVYFEGANYGNHMCSCDVDDSCNGSETFANKCNCDNTFDQQWRQDKGLITNKTALPITAFSYGFLIYEVMEARVEVGRLKCAGHASHSSPPLTCRDLKMGGEQRSGLYLLEDSENNMFPMMSKCEMDGDGYDKVEEQKQGWMKISSGPASVQFAVRNSAEYAGPLGSPIRFDETVVNNGDSFNRNTFTAPVAGEYEFSFSATSTGSDEHHFTIDIMTTTTNGTDSWTMKADNYQFTSIVKTWIQPLKLGDKVRGNKNQLYNSVHRFSWSFRKVLSLERK